MAAADYCYFSRGTWTATLQLLKPEEKIGCLIYIGFAWDRVDSQDVEGKSSVELGGGKMG